MRPSEIEAIYNDACRIASNRPVPEAAQLKIWRQIMGGFDAEDLRGGLGIWWLTEKFLPMPAELKPLAERARRERTARSEIRRGLVMWKCRVCAWTMSGHLTLEDRALRFCRSSWGPLLPVDAPRINGMRPERKQLGQGVMCGAQLDILHDERPR